MCGFAGAVVWDERYRVSPQTLRKMSAAVAHRGPDGEGFHHTRLDSPIDPANPQVALAFRRLAILDPDWRSMQPFTAGSKTLVFNGEIYNFRDLRQELTTRLPDWHWRTTGDTEVLLAAYTAWGDQCVEHLNGMFAFAVWDEAQKTLFLARDRMGQKPLYMAAGCRGGSVAATDEQGAFDWFAFASEPAALWPLSYVGREVDPAALARYLAFGCTPWTMLRSIYCVGPGCTSTIRRRGMNERAFFDPNATSTALDRSSTSLRTTLSRAVERQLVSDVPLGVFLSGGVDSSVIAACARQFGPVHTFSVQFDDPRYDESGPAAAVAKHLGTEHQTFRVAPDAAADLPRLARVFGTPFGDSSALPTSYLARETRHYVKVALSGDGGDELFGGYDRYRAMRIGSRLRSWGLSRLPSLRSISRRQHPKSSWARASKLIESLRLSDADRYESYVRLFDGQTIDDLLLMPTPFENRPITHPVASLYERFRTGGLDEVQSALAVDRITYLPDDLLTKVDRASMLHNLEVRSPFMDHELVIFAAGLKTDQLLRGGPKRMLREAFAADLPAWVFKRKKMGFAVPIGEWFRGPLRAMLRDTLFSSHAFGRSHFNMRVVDRLVEEHELQRVDHSQRLYALLMLELWWNTVRG